MQAIAIVALCIASAVVYGILLDQVTARVCIEYFTIGHPPVFDTDSPTLLGIGWGIIATWWAGLLLGIPLAIAARVGRYPRRGVRSLVRPIVVLLVVMGVCAVLAGIAGFMLGSTGEIRLAGRLASDVPRDRHARPLADGAAHLASYFVGFAGALVVIARVWRSRDLDPADGRAGRHDEESFPRSGPPGSVVGPRPESPVARSMMIRSVLLAAFILPQAAALLAAGVATIWWSSELMLWLIHMVGEERALGADNVIHLEDGGTLLTNPGAMIRWTIPIWALGLVQITAAVTLIGLWLSRRRIRPLAAAAVVIVPVCLLGPGCSGPPPETATLERADRLVLYEGLPHQFYEPKALAAEQKSKPTVTLHGFPFYRETFEPKPGDGERLKALLSDPNAFSPYSGEKKCGGFHPDYAVEWSAGGQVYRALVCFGCFEAKIYSPDDVTTYDVGRDGQERFKALLQPYRKNRPPFQPIE